VIANVCLTRKSESEAPGVLEGGGAAALEAMGGGGAAALEAMGESIKGVQAGLFELAGRLSQAEGEEGEGEEGEEGDEGDEGEGEGGEEGREGTVVLPIELRTSKDDDNDEGGFSPPLARFKLL